MILHPMQLWQTCSKHLRMILRDLPSLTPISEQIFHSQFLLCDEVSDFLTTKPSQLLCHSQY